MSGTPTPECPAFKVLREARRDNVTIDQAVDKRLAQAQEEERKEIMLQWLQDAQLHEEKWASFVRCVWERLNKGVGNSTEARQCLKEAANYNTFIQPMIKLAKSTDKMKERDFKAITNQWGQGWAQRMTTTVGYNFPARASFQFLKQLKGFCMTVDSEDRGYQLLREAIIQRPVNGRRTEVLIATDIKRARSIMEPSSTTSQMEGTIGVKRQTEEPNQPSPIAASGPKRRCKLLAHPSSQRTGSSPLTRPSVPALPISRIPEPTISTSTSISGDNASTSSGTSIDDSISGDDASNSSGASIDDDSATSDVTSSSFSTSEVSETDSIYKLSCPPKNNTVEAKRDRPSLAHFRKRIHQCTCSKLARDFLIVV
ncbi:MAG: hypothetical protein Q9187_000415 [Circinaria calcarea]